MIASDIDGTLLKDSTPDISPMLIDTIEKLVDQGIIFVAASGREYSSIKKVFHKIADKIVFIASNGAQIMYQDQCLQLTEMNQEYVKEIVNKLREYRDTCEFLVATTPGTVIETQNKDFLNLLQFGYYNTVHQTENVFERKEPIFKVSGYRKESIRDIGENNLIPLFQDKVRACMSGEEWVDFMDYSVDKGNALQFLQQYFGITKEETMVFGDNSNDVGMILAAGESYAVENAVEEAKAAAKYICPPYYENGVHQVIKKLVS